jgi:hypothetical protein
MPRRLTLFLAFLAIGAAGYLLRRGNEAEGGDDGAAPPPRPPSKHIGTVGERVKNLGVTITKVDRLDEKDDDGEIVTSTVVLMQDAENNVLRWVTAGDKASKLPKAGSHALLLGKIKAHTKDGPNGDAVTVVSHCRFRA